MERGVSRSAVLLVAGLTLAGCASSAAGGGQAGSSAPAGSSGPAKTVQLTAADNGRRITVSDGATVVVSLDSTYWHMAPVSSAALRAGRTAVHAGKSHIPGMGTGTVVTTYHATKAGSAVVAANRTTCGEAMACSPSQSRYRVTIVVR